MKKNVYCYSGAQTIMGDKRGVEITGGATLRLLANVYKTQKKGPKKL